MLLAFSYRAKLALQEPLAGHIAAKPENNAANLTNVAGNVYPQNLLFLAGMHSYSPCQKRTPLCY